MYLIAEETLRPSILEVNRSFALNPKSIILEPSVRRLIIIHRKLTGPGVIVTRPSSPFIEIRALRGQRKLNKNNRMILMSRPMSDKHLQPVTECVSYIGQRFSRGALPASRLLS